MKKLVAFTGAGISKGSGIPTFNEMGDLRDKLSREYFENNTEELFMLLGEMRRTCENAEPNPAHIALVQYDIPVITMNIDSLHHKAGSKTLLEVHGSLKNVICSSCKTVFDFKTAEEAIYCKLCGGLLEPDVVLYGDAIRYYHKALELIGTAEELLVIGTSFYTSTAVSFVDRAKMAGIKVKLINEAAEIKLPEYLRSISPRHPNGGATEGSVL